MTAECLTSTIDQPAPVRMPATLSIASVKLGCPLTKSRSDLQPIIDHPREAAQGRDDIRTECAGRVEGRDDIRTECAGRVAGRG